MKNKIDSTGVVAIMYVVFIIGVCIFLLASCGHEVDKAWNRYEITTKVTDKGIKNYGNSSTYLIYTKDVYGEVQVLEITDNLLSLRFDSSNVYANIEVGKTYTFVVGGDRVELFSWYPNIYEYKVVGGQTSDE